MRPETNEHTEYSVVCRSCARSYPFSQRGRVCECGERLLVQNVGLCKVCGKRLEDHTKKNFLECFPEIYSYHGSYSFPEIYPSTEYAGMVGQDLWQKLVLAKATITIPVANLQALEQSTDARDAERPYSSRPRDPLMWECECRTFMPRGVWDCTGCGKRHPFYRSEPSPESEGGLSDVPAPELGAEPAGSHECLTWLQYLLQAQGEGHTPAGWYILVKDASVSMPLTGPDGEWFERSLAAGLWRLKQTDYDGIVNVNLHRALETMRHYYAYHSEENGIGPLMMALAIEVEKTVMALESGARKKIKTGDKRTFLQALGAIRNQCDVWKYAAMATGTPAVPPTGPVSGDGSGHSIAEAGDPEEWKTWKVVKSNAALVADNNIQCKSCGAVYSFDDLSSDGLCKCGKRLLKRTKQKPTMPENIRVRG